MFESKTLVQPAHVLRSGDRIKLLDKELTIRKVRQDGDWIELFFEEAMWNPDTESWVQTYGCHFGFCFNVVKK